VKIDEVAYSRVAVWGLGQEGLALAELLHGYGADPVFIDDDPAPAAARLRSVLGDGVRVLDPASVAWSAVDVVVRSPGVSRYRAELHQAVASGVSVTTAMAMWLEDFAEAKVLAITGTKGKSTTAALAAAVLGHGGADVALIGNIGIPVTETYGRPVADAYVVEVSSYQAAEVAVSPGVCVLTSLAPDHLDWHGGEEAYYRDKLRLIEAGPPGKLAVNAGNAEALARTEGHPHRTLFGPRGRVAVGTGGHTVEVDGEAVADLAPFAVPGRHNGWNLCGAVAGAWLLTGEPPRPDAIQATIEEFVSLPSRCRTVGDRDRLTFVDDALASNPFATMTSLDAFTGRELTLILGGLDRGVDPTQLIESLVTRQPSPRVLVLPPDPERMIGAFRSTGEGRSSELWIEASPGLAEAVGTALSVTPPGGVVLFSPAAPTPAGQGGYGERSRQFISAIGMD
jgi:UDP-N-acetylmuramoyl-L-alanine---L-glutamate ligase